jgi:hypothetical protein
MHHRDGNSGLAEKEREVGYGLGRMYLKLTWEPYLVGKDGGLIVKLGGKKVLQGWCFPLCVLLLNVLVRVGRSLDDQVGTHHRLWDRGMR